MSLQDAAQALDELAAGRVPDLGRALAGLVSLDALPLGAGDQVLLEAGATLELLVATGGTANLFTAGRERAVVMADAVRRVIGQHG